MRIRDTIVQAWNQCQTGSEQDAVLEEVLTGLQAISQCSFRGHGLACRAFMQLLRSITDYLRQGGFARGIGSRGGLQSPTPRLLQDTYRFLACEELVNIERELALDESTGCMEHQVRRCAARAQAVARPATSDLSRSADVDATTVACPICGADKGDKCVQRLKQ